MGVRTVSCWNCSGRCIRPAGSPSSPTRPRRSTVSPSMKGPPRKGRVSWTFFRGRTRARFRRCRLSTLHRTNSAQLGAIFAAAARCSRRPVLTVTPHCTARSPARRPARRPTPSLFGIAEDHLLLYRSRREVVRISSELSTQGIPHQLRLSGLPVCVQPWVGWLLAGTAGQSLGKSRVRVRVGDPRDGRTVRVAQPGSLLRPPVSPGQTAGRPDRPASTSSGCVAVAAARGDLHPGVRPDGPDHRDHPRFQGA